MKEAPIKEVEKYRMTKGILASSQDYGNNGCFIIPFRKKLFLNCVVSDEGGWEHVSIDANGRCPVWKEMCFIKDLFWEKDEAVIQYHPAESEYIRTHPYTLHLWKPIGIELPKPPLNFV